MLKRKREGGRKRAFQRETETGRPHEVLGVNPNTVEQHEATARETKMRRETAACCIALALLAPAVQAAHAERWVQAGPVDSSLWYDADSVRSTTITLLASGYPQALTAPICGRPA